MIGKKLGLNDVDENVDKLEEGVECVYEIAEKSLNDLYDIIDNQYGITCFSKKPDIPLMWSHYADKHRGFVVEYDISQIDEEDIDKILYLMPVNYSKTRPKINVFELQKYKEHSIRTQMIAPIIKEVLDMIFVKAKEWDYEEEIRNIVYVNDESERKIDFKYVKSIYLGVKASDNLISLMKELCKKEKWSLYKYEIHDDEYRLCSHQIEI